jgi:flagellar motor protein MotB
MTTSMLKRGAVMLPLVVPLLGGCVWKSDYDAVQAQNNQLKQEVASLQAQNAAASHQVGRLQGAVLYTLQGDLLFQPGGYQVSEAGKQLIGRAASKLAATQSQKVIVVGYTDNTPIGPDLAREGITSNEILSQKRAEAVMAVAISQGVKADMISAEGRGDADPVAPNTTPAGRAKNRRVELRGAPPS